MSCVETQYTNDFKRIAASAHICSKRLVQRCPRSEAKHVVSKHVTYNALQRTAAMCLCSTALVQRCPRGEPQCLAWKNNIPTISFGVLLLRTSAQKDLLKGAHVQKRNVLCRKRSHIIPSAHCCHVPMFEGTCSKMPSWITEMSRVDKQYTYDFIRRAASAHICSKRLVQRCSRSEEKKCCRKRSHTIPFSALLPCAYVRGHLFKDALVENRNVWRGKTIYLRFHLESWFCAHLLEKPYSKVPSFRSEKCCVEKGHI